jgi:hypothetical protein
MFFMATEKSWRIIAFSMNQTGRGMMVREGGEGKVGEEREG